MTITTDLDLARDAFARHAWSAAAESYAAADRAGSLGALDLGQAGLATHLIGDDETAASQDEAVGTGLANGGIPG